MTSTRYCQAEGDRSCSEGSSEGRRPGQGAALEGRDGLWSRRFVHREANHHPSQGGLGPLARRTEGTFQKPGLFIMNILDSTCPPIFLS